MSGRAEASGLVLRWALAWLTSAGLTLTGLAGSAAADTPPSATAELSRCASLASASDRLACYDSMVCGAIPAAARRLACYDAVAQGKAPESAPAPEVSVARSEPGRSEPASRVDPGSASAGSDFGIVKRKPSVEPSRPEQITAVVAGLTTNQPGTVSVSLDNGQSWTLRDADPRLQTGDTVTIRRAALGSFLMTTPSHRSYRVQRTR